MVRMLAIFGLLASQLSPLKGAPSEDDTITIINSGSTNRSGFRIVVDRFGVAEFTSTPRRFGATQPQPGSIRRTLPSGLAAKFYSHLEAARPLGSLPVIHCAKSASFGTSLVVAFGGEQTPDLSCGDGGNAMVRDLIRDTDQIVALMQAK